MGKKKAKARIGVASRFIACEERGCPLPASKRSRCPLCSKALCHRCTPTHSLICPNNPAAPAAKRREHATPATRAFAASMKLPTPRPPTPANTCERVGCPNPARKSRCKQCSRRICRGCLFTHETICGRDARIPGARDALVLRAPSSPAKKRANPVRDWIAGAELGDQRAGAAGDGWEGHAFPPAPLSCKWCGVALPRTRKRGDAFGGHGRRKEFCSARCRQRNSRANRTGVDGRLL